MQWAGHEGLQPQLGSRFVRGGGEGHVRPGLAVGFAVYIRLQDSVRYGPLHSWDSQTGKSLWGTETSIVRNASFDLSPTNASATLLRGDT